MNEPMIQLIDEVKVYGRIEGLREAIEIAKYHPQEVIRYLRGRLDILQTCWEQRAQNRREAKRTGMQGFNPPVEEVPGERCWCSPPPKFSQGGPDPDPECRRCKGSGVIQCAEIGAKP